MPRTKPDPKKSSDREPGLVAEIRLAILESRANCYQIALKAGLDEGSVRKFVARQRSLSLESAARLVDALGLKMTRPAKPRKFPGREPDPRTGFEVAQMLQDAAGLSPPGETAPDAPEVFEGPLGDDAGPGVGEIAVEAESPQPVGGRNPT